MNNEDLPTKRNFIHYLIKKLKGSLIREDDNLITFNTLKYGKIEFILFEYIDKQFISKIDEYVYGANIRHLYFSKVSMLNYVMSDYYLHNDKEEKIITTLKDILEIEKNSDELVETFENEGDRYSYIEPILISIITNTMFIDIYYQYDHLLWWEDKYLNYETDNKEFKTLLKRIAAFFEKFNKIASLKKYLEIANSLVKDFYNGKIQQILLDEKPLEYPSNSIAIYSHKKNIHILRLQEKTIDFYNISFYTNNTNLKTNIFKSEVKNFNFKCQDIDYLNKSIINLFKYMLPDFEENLNILTYQDEKIIPNLAIKEIVDRNSTKSKNYFFNIEFFEDLKWDNFYLKLKEKLLEKNNNNKIYLDDYPFPIDKDIKIKSLIKAKYFINYQYGTIYLPFKKNYKYVEINLFNVIYLLLVLLTF